MKNHRFIQCTEVDIKGLKKNVEGVVTRCYTNGSYVRRKRKPKRYLSLLAECRTVNEPHFKFILTVKKKQSGRATTDTKKGKVKLSRYRPEQGLGNPEG